jgi:hypothetical protein
MEPLLKGSQARFGMGGIQEAAVDPAKSRITPGDIGVRRY